MDGFRVLEIKKSVFESNDREADLVREQLKRDRTFLLNLMSSPGCGKVVLEGHIRHCVRDGIEHGDADKTIENFTKAVERFSNMG